MRKWPSRTFFATWRHKCLHSLHILGSSRVLQYNAMWADCTHDGVCLSSILFSTWIPMRACQNQTLLLSLGVFCHLLSKGPRHANHLCVIQLLQADRLYAWGSIREELQVKISSASSFWAQYSGQGLMPWMATLADGFTLSGIAGSCMAQEHPDKRWAAITIPVHKKAPYLSHVYRLVLVSACIIHLHVYLQVLEIRSAIQEDRSVQVHPHLWDALFQTWPARPLFLPILGSKCEQKHAALM